MKHSFATAVIVFAVFALGGAASAQGTGDPTRPPQAQEAAPNGAAPEGGNQLQSIVFPQRGKAVAVIGGQVVSVGGKIGDAQVVRITESAVVLRGPEGEQVLQMTPAVDKQPVRETREATRAQKSKAGAGKSAGVGKNQETRQP